MIRVLLLVVLLGISTAQQAQLVYDKHFVDTPQHQPQNYLSQYANHQNYAPHPVSQHSQTPWLHHPTNQHANIAMFPPQTQASQLQTQFQHNHSPDHHESMPQFQHGIPQEYQHPTAQFQPQSPLPVPYHPNAHHGPSAPQQQHGPHPSHHHLAGSPQSLPPGAIPMPIPTPGEFATRRGPIDNMIKGAKHYFPGGSGKKRRPGTPIRFLEMNRLPKPPKYPLYDMPDLGMATPPPPPLMHPMSIAATNLLASYSQAPQHLQRGGRAPPRGKKPPLRRPPPPQMPRRPTRPGQSRQAPPHGQRPHRRPPHGKHSSSSSGGSGYEHNMASNLEPQVNSPPLGRPLNFDEYMKRPSHSFTDDPWNFDPFAANYNSGMNTFAMKYNYDPLGMNSLDKTQSHLDPEQLSYPGDYHTLQDTNLNIGKVTQVGGWDKSPDTYRSSTLTPPPRKDPNNRNNYHDLNGVRRHQHSQYSPNSFNVYDQSDSASVVKAESLNLNPLKILSDANPGMEFTIESSTNGDGVGETYKGGSSNYDTPSQYKEYSAWRSYPQSAHDVYDGLDTGSMASHTVNNYGKSPQSQDFLKQLEGSAKYENGKYDAQTQLHTFALSQDYVQRDRPLSDLSDNYNPHGDGGLSTDLTPPSESAAMFKRDGSRTVRQEKTPLIELEGLSLFKDILKDDRAKATRSELIRVLSN